MLEKHHIVFKGRGGLDFELNYKRLSPEDHRGTYGPHLDRRIDLAYKIEMQVKLEKVLHKDYYQVEELIEALGLKEQQAYKAFRKLQIHKGGYETLDVIRRLMGGKLYL